MQNNFMMSSVSTMTNREKRKYKALLDNLNDVLKLFITWDMDKMNHYVRTDIQLKKYIKFVINIRKEFNQFFKKMENYNFSDDYERMKRDNADKDLTYFTYNIGETLDKINFKDEDMNQTYKAAIRE